MRVIDPYTSIRISFIFVTTATCSHSTVRVVRMLNCSFNLHYFLPPFPSFGILSDRNAYKKLLIPTVSILCSLGFSDMSIKMFIASKKRIENGQLRCKTAKILRMMEFMLVRASRKRKPPHRRPWKTVAHMIIQICIHDPKKPLEKS